jgi:hypothetical protein
MRRRLRGARLGNLSGRHHVNIEGKETPDLIQKSGITLAQIVREYA